MTRQSVTFFVCNTATVEGVSNNWNVRKRIFGQRRFRSTCTFARSDQSLLKAHLDSQGCKFLHADNKTSDQTTCWHIRRWIFQLPRSNNSIWALALCCSMFERHISDAIFFSQLFLVVEVYVLPFTKPLSNDFGWQFEEWGSNVILLRAL